MITLFRLFGLLALIGLSFSANAQWKNFTILSNGSAIYYTPYQFSGVSTIKPIIGTTVRPAGATTQWITFDMKSNNYFGFTDRSGSGPHIAIGIRANATCAPLGTNANCTTNRTGVGIVFGDVSAAGNGTIGCQDAPRAQVENYTGTVVPHLFKGTCSSKLTDGHWYHVAIHAHDNGAVAYWITDKTTNKVTSGGVNAGPSSSPGVKAATGYFIAGVDGLQGRWGIEFSGVASGWF